MYLMPSEAAQFKPNHHAFVARAVMNGFTITVSGKLCNLNRLMAKDKSWGWPDQPFIEVADRFSAG